MAGEEVGIEPTVPEGTLAKASFTFPSHPVSASLGSLAFVHFLGSLRKNCACTPCKADRRQNCDNPHQCCITAQKLLDELHPKYHPN
ncbi:hypothetical protein BKA93DRAFT_726099 [Sparassis latifolia]